MKVFQNELTLICLSVFSVVGVFWFSPPPPSVFRYALLIRTIVKKA